MPYLFSASERRQKLNQAQIMLIFTPQLVEDPLVALQEIIEHVDVIQVRPKGLGIKSQEPSSARECLDWSQKVLHAVKVLGPARPLVLVNDRVDVAQMLMHNGLDGVHLGQEDTPWQVARELLGPAPLIGLSTHSYDQVRHAADTSIDYLGFGPIFATATKALKASNNAVSAWVAHRSSQQPLFPIGGITPSNAWQLTPVGRAAIASGILCSPDPKQTASDVRRALTTRGKQNRLHC
ncbi:MAG: thiamine-phosphate diphosphorylase [Glaciecola sp.]|jgi:thiamine-phosphate diphosphorylase